jgi:hypothetical protein
LFLRCITEGVTAFCHTRLLNDCFRPLLSGHRLNIRQRLVLAAAILLYANTFSRSDGWRRTILVVFSRTPVRAKFSQFPQRAARAPFEAVTKAGGVGEPDQLANNFGGRPRTGLLLDFLRPEPD